MTEPRLTALLVEDNPDDADVLSETLREARAPVDLTTAESLHDAYDRCEEHRFDVVLLDLSLPDSQGLATVERALVHMPDLPILVLTGLEDEGLGAAAVQAGAQDYLVKGQPDASMLVRCMRYAVERQRLLTARTEDALVFAAVARAGAALLAAPTGSALLEQLCAVTLNELHCDSTAVWILDRATQTYVPAAAFPTAAWHAVAERRAPLASVMPLIANGQQRDPVLWLTPRLMTACATLLPDHLDAGDILCLSLHRGSELIGVQLCCYERRPNAEGVTQRIARGLVHAATLALSNAQLFDELERSNTIKTYFAATMSHELRGTLFAIGGLGDMLVDQVGDGDALRLARAISQRSRDSLGLIQAALELTRSEVRPADPDAAEIDIPAFVQRLAADTHVPSDKNDLVLEWDVQPALPPLRADAIKLDMALRNLIGNAIKFTERGFIRVAVAPLEGGVRFTVADTGVGIAAADLPHLFEPFTQAHGQRSRRAGGAGLGLYIVNRLVDLLGGTVAVDSQAGTGTTFSITVPVIPPVR